MRAKAIQPEQAMNKRTYDPLLKDFRWHSTACGDERADAWGNPSASMCAEFDAACEQHRRQCLAAMSDKERTSYDAFMLRLRTCTDGEYRRIVREAPVPKRWPFATGSKPNRDRIAVRLRMAGSKL
ncbi:hypothetical protein [Fontivita pretiosa]|uniref:hypothetical protein n=1 Tax=Fontivita pretiosa TaxID=2989684 RepID=UPI003D1685B1